MINDGSYTSLSPGSSLLVEPGKLRSHALLNYYVLQLIPADFSFYSAFLMSTLKYSSGLRAELNRSSKLSCT